MTCEWAGCEQAAALKNFRPMHYCLDHMIERERRALEMASDLADRFQGDTNG